MALFVELDDDAEPPQDPRKWQAVHARSASDASAKEGEANRRTHSGPLGTKNGEGTEEEVERGGKAHGEERANPNRNATTEALGCYPYVLPCVVPETAPLTSIIIAIASRLDLNTLHNLSLSCRQVRAGLLPYRPVLISHSLRCANDALPAANPDETLRFRATAANYYYHADTLLGAGGAWPDGEGARRRLGGAGIGQKSGSCARDLVAECRRCGVVVCRNCTIKQPSPYMLADRHRRLCAACTRAPIGALTKPRLPAGAPLDQVRRAACTCDVADADDGGVWLCQPCGRSIRAADAQYAAIWRWRRQYGEVLGGLGTGIGDGDRGVICGRESSCCGAKEREQETDCDAEDYYRRHCAGEWVPSLSAMQSPLAGSPSGSQLLDPAAAGDVSAGAGLLSSSASTASSSASARTPSPSHQQLGPSYSRHEIEGIGGVVKRKLVRMVRVGASVPDWDGPVPVGADDGGNNSAAAGSGAEGAAGGGVRRNPPPTWPAAAAAAAGGGNGASKRERGRGRGVLGPEATRRTRSWCGWCWRVVVAEREWAEVAREAAEAADRMRRERDARAGKGKETEA